MNKPFIINFKNYGEASAERTVELAKAAQSVAKKLDVEIVVAPPQPSIALVSRSVDDISVICQHVDDAQEGATTGFFVPEVARSYGAAGSLVNHSEHRIAMPAIKNLVERLRRLQMTSIVCARTPAEVAEIANFAPDFIAIEPPELIGSGRAVSKESPSIITDSIKAAGVKSKVICGAGITDRGDVSKAMELGSHGVLVASGIVKSQPWPDKITDLALGMQE